jgi:hypothetical protein
MRLHFAIPAGAKGIAGDFAWASSLISLGLRQ